MPLLLLLLLQLGQSAGEFDRAAAAAAERQALVTQGLPAMLRHMRSVQCSSRMCRAQLLLLLHCMRCPASLALLSNEKLHRYKNV
jgi:hypothetical protein